MRVVGGVARGRPLAAPRVDDVRPTSARVREAIFDILSNQVDVDGAVVADLFAGSGALGIEALSRGAAHVTFVEHRRDAAAVIASNLVLTGLAEPASPGWGTRRAKVPVGAPRSGPRHEIICSDVLGSLDRLRGVEVEVAMVDPPYRFTGWRELGGALRARLVLAESDRPIELGPRFTLIRHYRYGGTLLFLARAADDGTGKDAS